MNCLVLGCGFLGSHTVVALAERGHEVRVISRSVSDWFNKNRPDNCELILADISDTRANIEKHLAWADVVVQLAGPAVPAFSNANPTINLMQEVIPTLSLLERMRTIGKGRVIFASASAVYGPQKTFPTKEDAPTAPISAYGVSKLAAEKYLHFFHVSSNLEYQVLRFSNVYGPGQTGKSGQGVIGIWLSRLARGEPLVLRGSGDTVRDFLYVDDAAEAIVAVVEQLKGPDILNVGSGVGTSLREVIQTVKHLTKGDIRVSTEPPEVTDITISYLDTKKIRSLTSWRPSTPLQEGIARAWDWIVQQLSNRRDP